MFLASQVTVTSNTFNRSMSPESGGKTFSCDMNTVPRTFFSGRDSVVPIANSSKGRERASASAVWATVTACNLSLPCRLARTVVGNMFTTARINSDSKKIEIRVSAMDTPRVRTLTVRIISGTQTRSIHRRIRAAQLHHQLSTVTRLSSRYRRGLSLGMSRSSSTDRSTRRLVPSGLRFVTRKVVTRLPMVD